MAYYTKPVPVEKKSWFDRLIQFDQSVFLTLQTTLGKKLFEPGSLVFKHENYFRDLKTFDELLKEKRFYEIGKVDSRNEAGFYTYKPTGKFKKLIEDEARSQAERTLFSDWDFLGELREGKIKLEDQKQLTEKDFYKPFGLEGIPKKGDLVYLVVLPCNGCDNRGISRVYDPGRVVLANNRYFRSLLDLNYYLIEKRLVKVGTVVEVNTITGNFYYKTDGLFKSHISDEVIESEISKLCFNTTFLEQAARELLN